MANKGRSSGNSESEDQNPQSISVQHGLKPNNPMIAAANNFSEASGVTSTSSETKGHPGSRTKLNNEGKQRHAKKNCDVEARNKDCGKNNSQLVVEKQTTQEPLKTASDSNRKTLIQQKRPVPNTPTQQNEGIIH